MNCAGDILAAANPIHHILDRPWRIDGVELPWMSSQVAVMILAGLILLVSMPLLTRLHVRRARRHSMGLIELIVLFVREKIARPAFGAQADLAVGYLATLFLFLLICNLMGLTPLMEMSEAFGLNAWGGTGPDGRALNSTPIGGTPTGGLWMPLALASLTLLAVIFSGYVGQVRQLWRRGPRVANHHQPAPAGGNFFLASAHWLQRYRYPLPVAAVVGVWTWLNTLTPPVPGVIGLFMWPILLVIELIGYVARCFALCIRLVANQSGGHILLAVLVMFLYPARGYAIALVGLPTALGIMALMMLEMLVAVIQAYIFTFLSALFISLAMNPKH